MESTKDATVYSDEIEFQPIKLKSSSFQSKNTIPINTNDDDSTDTDDDKNGESVSSCPICLELWTSSGRHRICSLKCGHLFGKCCIEKWLAGSNNNGTPRNKCPECNAIARRPDIRVLYSKNILVMDPKEKDDLVKTIEILKAENMQLKQAETCMRMEIQVIKNESTKLKLQAPFSGVGEFFICKNISLSVMEEACRSLSFNPNHNICLATCTKSVDQHGFVKQSLLDPNGPVEFIFAHSKACRAIATTDNYVATTGNDSTLVISSLHTGIPLATFHLPPNPCTVGWSICFESAEIIWVGASNRKLYLFDLTKSIQNFVLEMSPPIEGPPLPIHSLCIVDRCLFGASLAGIFKLDLNTKEAIGFKNLSGCFNLSSNGNDLLLASFRRGNGLPAEYILYDTTFSQITAITGSSPNTRISKSSFVSVGSGMDLVAIIDETSGSVNIWQCNHDTKANLLWQKIPVPPQPVFDVLLANKNMLCVLGEKSLFLFKSF
jgi:hypothetical protein